MGNYISDKNYGFPKDLDVIIPEAYQVTISLTPFLSDSKNLEFQAIRQGRSLYSATIHAQTKTPGRRRRIEPHGDNIHRENPVHRNDY